MTTWDRILFLILAGKADQTLFIRLIEVAYSRGVIDGLEGIAGPNDTKEMILPRVIQVINAGEANANTGGVR